MHGCSQLDIVHSEGLSYMWAQLSTFCLLTFRQVVRFVDVDSFLQCIEFQMIIIFEKHNLCKSRYLINEIHILTIIDVSLKILHNRVDVFLLKEPRFVNTVFINFNYFDNMNNDSVVLLVYL